MLVALAQTVNLCNLYFSLVTAAAFSGAVLYQLRNHVPDALVNLFEFGKFKSKRSLPMLEVPQSYFRHFYITAALIYYPIFLYEVASVYLFGNEVSWWLSWLIDFSATSARVPKVPATHALIAIILMFLQTLRRCYESTFISVFNPNARMHIFHYFIGMTFYNIVIVTILSEAAIFANGTGPGLRFQDVGLWEAFSVILFSFAWYHQHAATVILADLRKDQKGKVVSQEYKIPRGDWFEYLSSPHYTAEIVMYTALTFLLWGATNWWYAYAFVVTNQCFSINASHQWYKGHFKDFPKSRKAFIPYVY